MSLLDQSLGQIATSIAGATAIFHQYKLDFCCGGQHRLRDAIAKKDLPEQDIVQALIALQQQPASTTDWRKAPTKELAEHILSRYHARHRAQFPELCLLARRVEHVHVMDPDCPTGLADHLDSMYQELESHMMKEEQILFPMLVRGMYPEGPLSVMEEEHQQHGLALQQLDALTNDLTLPPHACNTWTALYLGLRELKEDLMEHILLENTILFVPPVTTADKDTVCCGSCG